MDTVLVIGLFLGQLLLLYLFVMWVVNKQLDERLGKDVKLRDPDEMPERRTGDHPLGRR